MKKILFLGYTVPIQNADGLSGISIAGNKMQWNIIHHIAKYSGISVDSITILPLAPFPRDTFFSKSHIWNIDRNVKTKVISFCNVPLIKQIWQVLSVYFACKKYFCDNPDATLICFNLFPQVGIPMRWLKQNYSRLKVIAILADLPIDDKTNRGFITGFLRKKFDQSTWKSISYCDDFIVLNEFVATNYIKGKRYIVIDGGVSDEMVDNSALHYNSPNRKSVVFSGALTEYNGIKRLIEAAQYLKDLDITIDIYGDGYLKKYVLDAAKNNGKIVYHGSVSNDDMMRIQRSAWLLINPRLMSDPISKVTFPSKTFEYMLSHRPILSTKLNGYSQQYSDKMFFCEDTALSIGNTIREIYKLPDNSLKEKADAAYQFVVSEKTWARQTEKIVSFIYE